MLKKFLIIILLLLCNVVYAGSYEDALAKNDKVFLFFYIQRCRTCNEFNKIYENIKTEDKSYGYVKVDANTPYGAYLFYKFKGMYVPYIILTDSKTKKSVNINHSCIMNEVCLMRAMKTFKG